MVVLWAQAETVWLYMWWTNATMDMRAKMTAVVHSRQLEFVGTAAALNYTPTAHARVCTPHPSPLCLPGEWMRLPGGGWVMNDEVIANYDDVISQITTGNAAVLAVPPAGCRVICVSRGGRS